MFMNPFDKDWENSEYTSRVASTLFTILFRIIIPIIIYRKEIDCENTRVFYRRFTSFWNG